MPLEVLPIIIVVIAVLGYLFYQNEKKRREELSAWAQRQGWHFSAAKQKGWQHDYAGLKLFERGHSRFGKNIVTGRFRGHEVVCLDYHYTTGHGKNRQNHQYGVVILRLDHPVIPLHIRREHVFDKVGEFLGSDDIDFESAEFSRTFHVTSPDRKWAFDVIHGRTMEYLLKSPRYFSISFGHNEIAIFKSSRCSPTLYEQAIKLAHDLYELIPPYVLEQMKGK